VVFRHARSFALRATLPRQIVKRGHHSLTSRLREPYRSFWQEGKNEEAIVWSFSGGEVAITPQFLLRNLAEV